MSEIELAEKVVQWLIEQHWDVYQEIIFSATGWGGKRADIVAVRAGYLWIIETKTSLTFTVMEQAAHWPAHFRSIAIPGSIKYRGELPYRIAYDYLHLRIIEVSGQYGIQEQFMPPLMRQNHSMAKYFISKLSGEHKSDIKAGSKGGGYYTPYRNTMDSVHNVIKAHPGIQLKEIIDILNGGYHYANEASARSCIRTALASWESDWCRVETVDGRTKYFAKETRVNP